MPDWGKKVRQVIEHREKSKYWQDIEDSHRRYCNILISVLCSDSIIEQVISKLKSEGISESPDELKQVIIDSLEDQILY